MGLAENLVDRYLQQAKNALIGNYNREIRGSFEDGVYHSDLTTSGFTQEDFNSLVGGNIDNAVERAQEIIQDRSIISGDDLWDLDEVYFLNYEQNEVVLRDGKEVFYLSGMDFSDPGVVERVKEQLELD